MSMSVGFRFKEIITKYPLLRGVLSYSIIWPASALIQQRIAGKTWGLLYSGFILINKFEFVSKEYTAHLVVNI